jgi:cytochrome c biogenesis protein CcdA
MQTPTRAALALMVTAGVFGALFVLLVSQSSAEGVIANFADVLPFGYAFGAGMVASLNPCGFFLLPSYVSYHLGIEERGFYESPFSSRFARASLLGLVATGGFILVFSVAGTIIGQGGRWLVTYFPLAGLVIGSLMVLLGTWLLVTDKSFGIGPAHRVMVAPSRNLANVFLFGIAYAICSLSCTLPVFLVVVGSSLAGEGFLYGLSQFVSYALGMGSILVAVTIGAALFRGAVARSLRAALPYVSMVSSLFLVGAGTYLIYYWVRYGDLFS